MPLRPGQEAPDFELKDQDGNSVRLSHLKGQRVVLYFYPKDETPGCTREACRFRDDYTAFRDAGAEVLGVSGDSPESHRGFSRRQKLPFRLLSDTDGRVRRLYHVSRTWGLIPGRVTFVIDREGIVQTVFSSQFRPEQHIEEALGSLRGEGGRL